MRSQAFPRNIRDACKGSPVQHHLDAGPFTRLRLDHELAAMAADDVLDDREPEAGALLLAARFRVDAVEPLGQPWHVLRFDAFAMVGYRDKIVVAAAAGTHRHLHPATLAAIFDGVVDEV